MNNPGNARLISPRIRRRLCAPWIVLLALPAALQAQFTFTTNNGAITITRYTGTNAVVIIPSATNGYPVVAIGNQAFQNCTLVTGVTIPSSVSSIGGLAFVDCSSLSNVAIPSSVTSIGERAFGWCTNLTGVTIPDSVTNIEYGTFTSCASLTEVTIGQGVASIADFAFSDCSSLADILIPDNVVSIGTYAFGNCSGLTSVLLPDSITDIACCAFIGCSSMTAITVDTNNALYCSADGVLFDVSQATLIECPGGKAGDYTIPSSVTVIGDGAFDECSGLTSVIIPDSVTNMGYYAFEHCRSLTCVTIGNGVSSIGDYAFSGCTSLTDVLIPSGVTSIENSAFAECSSLTSVTIPSGVTSIGGAAFAGCESLANITIPSGVTSIGGAAFRSCRSLTNIAIPNNVTDIGAEMFAWCDSLTTVTLGNSVTSIGQGTFHACSSLTDITIPNSVTGIEEEAFAWCTSLASVTIPDSVTGIGVDAFAGCQSLIDITIPDSVTNIGYEAFFGCSSLLGIYFKGNAPALTADVLGSDSCATVYYLEGTTGWGPTYGGLPTALWPPPTIRCSPLSQTAEWGSAVDFWVEASGTPPPLWCLWYLNDTNLVSCSTNCDLYLTNAQFSQAGAYTAILTNGGGAVTSSPAMLQVIAPVERRPVPGVFARAEAGSTLNLDCTDTLGPAANWQTFETVAVGGTAQWCFDLAAPLPPQRFYRAWQTGTPVVKPSLELHLVPAITLTGNVGDHVRVDGINQFGPTDAWFTLETVTLTNTSQLYFDVSVVGQPQRLYRLVQLP